MRKFLAALGLALSILIPLSPVAVPAQAVLGGINDASTPNKPPAPSIGNEANWYIDFLTGNVFGPKSSGQWSLTPSAQFPVLVSGGANFNITSLHGLTTPLSPSQGGTGASSLTGLLLGNGTSPATAIAPGSGVAAALAQAVTGSGSIVLSNAPTFTTSGLTSAITTSQTAFGNATQDFYANNIYTTFGALSNPGHNNYGLGVNCNVNSASYSGQLFCRASILTVNTLGTPGFPNDQFAGDFNSVVANTSVTGGDPGIFGGNDNVRIQAGNTGWGYIIGREIDVTAQAALTDTKNGLRIVEASSDAYLGINSDAAIWLGNQTGAIGWKNIIQITPGTVASGAALFTVAGTWSGFNQPAYGLYLAGPTYSSYQILGNNFALDNFGGLYTCEKNSQSVPVSLSGGGLYCQQNFFGGGGQSEVDFFNETNSAGLSFAWYQKTGAGTDQLEMYLSTTGLVVSGSISTTTTFNVGASVGVTGSTCTAWSGGICTHL